MLPNHMTPCTECKLGQKSCSNGARKPEMTSISHRVLESLTNVFTVEILSLYEIETVSHAFSYHYSAAPTSRARSLVMKV